MVFMVTVIVADEAEEILQVEQGVDKMEVSSNDFVVSTSNSWGRRAGGP
jgi:hypothetical protein